MNDFDAQDGLPPADAALAIETRASDPGFRRALMNPSSPAGRLAQHEWDQLHERAHSSRGERSGAYASDVAGADERVPAAPSGYHVNLPGYVDAEDRPGAFSAMRETMHALDASNRFAAEFTRLAEMAHRTEWTPERLSEQRHRTEARLRHEWGGEYDSRMARIRGFLGRRAPEFARSLAETPLGDNEILLRRFDEMAAREL